MLTRSTDQKSTYGLIAMIALVSAIASAQHVHGVAELGVVIENSTIAVSIEAPLADIIGFEHEPEDDEQVVAIRRAAALLADPANLFEPSEAAGCSLAGHSIDAPGFFHKNAGTGGSTDNESAHADRNHQRSGKAHGESAGHGDDDSRSDHHHSNLNASYEWTCSDIARLDGLALSVAENFGSIETINVQVLTASGAYVDEVPGNAASISLAPK